MSLLNVQTLLVKTKDDTTFKRLKRKLNKPGVSLDIKNCNKAELSQILTDKLKRGGTANLHVYLDRQTLLFDIYSAAEPLLSKNLPKTWDVLCLQSTVKSYDYNDDSNSVYWCKANVDSSVNFIINASSFRKCIQILKSCDGALNQLFSHSNTFVVTQYSYSDALEKESSPELIPELPPNNDAPRFKVSFITTVIDEHSKSFAAISVLSFLKCSTDHELIVVDCCNFDKTLDLTVDARIKVVKIDCKNDTKVPLGTALNIAVKNASNDVIFHLLPSNVYLVQNINRLLNAFDNSCADMFVAADLLMYIAESEKSVYRKTPTIANCIYYKRFWNVNHFSEMENDEIKLLHHFIKGRTFCVKSFSSVYSSFQIVKSTPECNYTDLGLNLLDLPIPSIHKALKLTLDEIKFSCLVE